MRYDAGTGAASRLSTWEANMKAHWLIVGLSMVALATIDTSHAASKKRQQDARSGVRHAPAAVAPQSSSGPARMYEARPGVWISTYDCITDDGYGRWLPCSAGPGKGGGQ
jgi:hypothetical protein